MWPTITDINENAYQPYAAGEISMNEMIGRSGDSLKTFMLKNTSKSNMKFFLDLKGTVIYESEQRSASAEENSESDEFIKPLEPITEIEELTPVDLE